MGFCCGHVQQKQEAWLRRVKKFISFRWFYSKIVFSIPDPILLDFIAPHFTRIKIAKPQPAYTGQGLYIPYTQNIK